MKFLAQFEGWSAHIPFVHVDRNHVAYLREADRIEGARDGLLPLCLASSISRVDGTEGTLTSAALEFASFDKDAVASFDYLCYQLPIGVRVDDSLSLYLLLSLRREFVPYQFGSYELEIVYIFVSDNLSHTLGTYMEELLNLLFYMFLFDLLYCHEDSNRNHEYNPFEYSVQQLL